MFVYGLFRDKSKYAVRNGRHVSRTYSCPGMPAEYTVTVDMKIVTTGCDIEGRSETLACTGWHTSFTQTEHHTGQACARLLKVSKPHNA